MKYSDKYRSMPKSAGGKGTGFVTGSLFTGFQRNVLSYVSVHRDRGVLSHTTQGIDKNGKQECSGNRSKYNILQWIFGSKMELFESFIGIEMGIIRDGYILEVVKIRVYIIILLSDDSSYAPEKEQYFFSIK